MEGITAVIAAIAGGLLTALGAFVTDRRKARDQRLARWEERKVDIYANFIEAVEDGLSGLIHIADRKETGRPYYDQDLPELLDVYRQSKERLRSYGGRIALVGAPVVRELAGQIVDGMKELQHREAAGSRASGPDFKRLELKIRALGERLNTEATRELGIDAN
jgi:hypothetical protein